MALGDRVKLVTRSKEEFEGILMPCSPDLFVLKLKSGYNMNFDKKNVSSLKILSKVQKKKKTLKKISSSASKRITLLHTGGTIASSLDYQSGAVSSLFHPEDLLSLFPELNSLAKIDSRLVCNMFSEDLRFDHYNLLVKEIEKEVKKGVNGVIVSTGTDTLHYTSAALAFALENLAIPVFVVGAQRSSDRGSSDAALNLLSAAYYIVESCFTGVAVCMHWHSDDALCAVLPACKVRKLHSSRRDAFRPVNAEVLAFVDYHHKKIEQIAPLPSLSGSFKVHLFNPKLKIGLLKTHTHMFPEEFSSYASFDGLVLEGSGLGLMPLHVTDRATTVHKKIAESLKSLIKKEVVVVMSSQCLFGRVHLDVYSKGRDIQSLGVIGHLNDMTPETSFIKLAWLLSNYKKKEEVKRLFMENLRGELSERSLFDGEFV